MDDFFDGDIMTLEDEDGNEVEVELMDTLEYNGCTYFAFIPAEVSLDGSYELMIMKQEIYNGEQTFATLDDEDEYNEMYQIFSERLEDAFEEEDGEEEESEE